MEIIIIEKPFDLDSTSELKATSCRKRTKRLFEHLNLKKHETFLIKTALQPIQGTSTEGHRFLTYYEQRPNAEVKPKYGNQQLPILPYCHKLVGAMFSPERPQVNWIRQVMAFFSELFQNLLECPLTHLPAGNARPSPFGAHWEGVHRNAGGAAS